MFKPRYYRAEAVLAKTSQISKARARDSQPSRIMSKLLADNNQSNVSSAELERSKGITIPDEEEHILRCLAARLF